MSVETTSKRDVSLRRILFVLGVIGLLDSAYLAYIKLANATATCGGIGDCDAVNSSKYAEIFGIPIALFGAGAYIFMLVIIYMEPRHNLWRENGPLALFVLTLLGVLYSAYLTYVEVAILFAICPYCVLSAIILVAMFAISVYRYLQTD
jgi:uncharacterized membrane protein